MKNLIPLLVLISLTTSAQSIQNFSLVNAADGKTISLNSYSSTAGVAVIFTSNDCPFDQYYLDRIRSLNDTYSSKIPVLLINAHNDPKESLESMKAYASRCSLKMPYLADKEQVVLNQFNARKSPEVFLLKNTSGKFTIVYHGAIDDNAQTSSEVRNTYLQTAIDNLLAGEKIEQSDVRPVGCSIRKN